VEKPGKPRVTGLLNPMLSNAKDWKTQTITMLCMDEGTGAYRSTRTRNKKKQEHRSEPVNSQQNEKCLETHLQNEHWQT